MNKIITFIIILNCIFLCGCIKNSSINIKERTTTQTLYELQQNAQQKSIVKKSSGIIIYKDVNTINNTKIRNSDFGPKDIDFDRQFKTNPLFK